MPSPLFSTGSPPVTTLISRRPPDRRSSVAVMRAATVGGCSPGLTATRKLQPLGRGQHRRGDDPGILAAPSGRQQHAVVAELIGGLRDLPEIGQVGGAAADCRAEIPAVPMGRQKPQHIDAFGDEARRCSRLRLLHGFGNLDRGAGSGRACKNTSAIFCCAATTSGEIGFTPYCWRCDGDLEHILGNAERRRELLGDVVAVCR